MRGNIFTINCMTGRLDALPGHVPIPLWTQNDLRLGSRRAGGLNPSAHRTVLRRRVFRRFGALIAEGLVAGHRARCPRSLPEGHSGREQWRVSGLRSCSLKVSYANETEEPNRGPTTTGIRPHQATSSHSRGWQMARQPRRGNGHPADRCGARHDWSVGETESTGQADAGIQATAIRSVKAIPMPLQYGSSPWCTAPGSATAGQGARRPGDGPIGGMIGRSADGQVRDLHDRRHGSGGSGCRPICRSGRR